MSTSTLTAEHAFLPHGIVGPTEIEVTDGVISAVRPAAGDVDAGTLCAGFIDVQVNGIDDVDVAAAEGEDWTRLDGLLLDQGVTAWCPTLVTAPLDAYATPLSRVAAAAGRERQGRPAILGAHLEGPFLGGAPGAHPPRLIRPPDLEWLAGLPEIVRLVTLAPEQPDADDAVALLAERGVVVSLGHSMANYGEAMACIEAGATLVTHLFNAMLPLHHRKPGLLGAGLSDDRLFTSLIADLVHVHPAVLKTAFLAKGRERAVLVTDAVAWRAERVGRISIALVDGAPRLKDGTLAGSALTMDQAIRNVVSAGIDLAAALAAATSAPAALMGETTRGRIAPCMRADLVRLSGDLAVVGVYVGGEPVRG